MFPPVPNVPDVPDVPDVLDVPNVPDVRCVRDVRNVPRVLFSYYLLHSEQWWCSPRMVCGMLPCEISCIGQS